MLTDSDMEVEVWLGVRVVEVNEFGERDEADSLGE